MATNGGSTTLRNIPDVALIAENVYVTYNNGSSGVFGGTSCAAPLWAGVTALVNQQAAMVEKASLGFANPAIYAIGEGLAYAISFHDITNGNNTWLESPTNYFAVPGYDLCTGWGTPTGQSLINILVPPDPLSIFPYTGFTSSGNIGGPFDVTSLTMTVTNLGPNPLTWSLGVGPIWLDVSTNGGLLPPGGSSPVMVTLNQAAADSLAVGTYTGTIWFTNLADSFVIPRVFTLNVLGAPVITSQPENQLVSQGSSATFAFGVTGATPLNYSWQKNGVAIAGASNSSYTTNNVQLANSGSQFVCVVTNIYGSVTSSPATLTVFLPVTLHSFEGPDGGSPSAGMLPASDGKLYGTTAYGGPYGAGTIFSLTTNGILTTFVSFNFTNGAYPMADLTQGTDGNIYGTTFGGGANDDGTVFQVTTNGVITTLVTFNNTNGANPYGGVVQGLDGNFYGTTYQGRLEYGGHRISHDNQRPVDDFGRFFNWWKSSRKPGSSADRNFYCTTPSGEPFGLGSVFRVTPNGSLTILVLFENVDEGAPYGGLTLGTDGYLYGTTSSLGGTIFKMTTNGVITTLAGFTGANGLTPEAPLSLSSDGSFYGTTTAGGSYNAGTFFRMTTDRTLTTLFSFAGSNGVTSLGRVALGADGNLYGTTAYGGPGYNGNLIAAMERFIR